MFATYKCVFKTRIFTRSPFPFLSKCVNQTFYESVECLRSHFPSSYFGHLRNEAAPSLLFLILLYGTIYRVSMWHSELCKIVWAGLIMVSFSFSVTYVLHRLHSIPLPLTGSQFNNALIIAAVFVRIYNSENNYICCLYKL